MKSWEAEVNVTAELAAELVDGQFPELAPSKVDLLGSGWDNAAFLVNRQYVFRFTRRAFAVRFFENEARILGRLADRLPLPIPNPIFHGRPVDGVYPWPFAGYRHLPGRTASAVSLSAVDRIGLAQPLGEFLKALHAIPVDEAIAIGAEPDPIRRLDIEYRTPYFFRDINQIATSGKITPPCNSEALMDAVEPSDRRSLVHGDLYVRHLLVDDARQLCGVIDWGDCHLGSPAIDLAVVHSILPPSAHSAFIDAYGPVDEREWRLARWRAAIHTAMLSKFAVDVDDVDLIRECDQSFRYLEELVNPENPVTPNTPLKSR